MMEHIIKDGTVRIPSIFMFEGYEALMVFLNRAKESNCAVVFENEKIVVDPNTDDFEGRIKLRIYSNLVGNREILNAYLRYLGDIEKMTWDNVQGK